MCSRRTTFRISFILCLIIGISGLLIAEVPMCINYQGKLFDAVGAPVPDGDYLVKFTIHTDSIAGARSQELWTSDFQYISTVDGFFNYVLGCNMPLPDSLFCNGAHRFLGITVNSQPEMAPRIRITSSAFAMQALRADTAGYVIHALSSDTAGYSLLSETSVYADTAQFIEGYPFLSAEGDTLRGGLVLYGADGFNGLLDVGEDYANLSLFNNGLNTVQLYGQNYGTMYLMDSDGTLAFSMDATNNHGGVFALFDSVGMERVYIRARSSGDGNIKLPDSAINNIEILDEPGIVSNECLSSVSVTLNETSMTDLKTVSITIPAPGYIYITGRCFTGMYDASMQKGASFQIDETSGGNVNDHHVSIQTDVPTGTYYQFPIYIDRVYYKDVVGTYEFRLEGMKNGAEGDVIGSGTSITAMYFPTSYGAVKTMTSDAGDNPEAVPVSIQNKDGSSETAYEIDLRYYELKAKAARLKAMEAERELNKARERIKQE